MKKFDRKSAREEFLWAGYEDWSGLWEAAWWIQTEYPDMKGTPARDAARSVLSELLDEGLVYLCLLDEDTSHETPIPTQKAHQILAGHESWDPPDSVKGQLRYATTEKGARPFFQPMENKS